MITFISSQEELKYWFYSRQKLKEIEVIVIKTLKLWVKRLWDHNVYLYLVNSTLCGIVGLNISFGWSFLQCSVQFGLFPADCWGCGFGTSFQISSQRNTTGCLDCWLELQLVVVECLDPELGVPQLLPELDCLGQCSQPSLVWQDWCWILQQNQHYLPHFIKIYNFSHSHSQCWCLCDMFRLAQMFGLLIWVFKVWTHLISITVCKLFLPGCGVWLGLPAGIFASGFMSSASEVSAI